MVAVPVGMVVNEFVAHESAEIREVTVRGRIRGYDLQLVTGGQLTNLVSNHHQGLGTHEAERVELMGLSINRLFGLLVGLALALALTLAFRVA